MADAENEPQDEIELSSGSGGGGAGQGQGGGEGEGAAGDNKRTRSITVAGVHLSHRQVPLIGIFIASIVLIVAVTTIRIDGWTGGWYGYSVSVGAVSLVLSFIGLLLTLKEDSQAMVKAGDYNNSFLLAWNLAGAVALTFWGAFQTTGNGYFACWALVIFSAMLVGVDEETLAEGTAGDSSLVGFLISSIVVLIAIIPYLNTNEPETIYAITLACLTIVLTGVLLAMERAGKNGSGWVQFGFLAVFSIMWIVLAFLLTFRGPFLVTGNGYFGSWAGAITSVFAAMAARP